VLTQPGIPLLSWGDEFGQPGANDPDNRRFMRFGAELNAREAALLAKVRAIGKARATHPGLMRGSRRTLLASGDLYVYARGAGPNLALIVLNRGAGSANVNVPIPADLGLQGAALKDAITGTTVDVSSGTLSFTLGARSAAVLLR
jgi:neopullulanase